MGLPIGSYCWQNRLQTTERIATMDRLRLMIAGLAFLGLPHATSVRGDEAKSRVFFEKSSSEVVECKMSLDLVSDYTVDWRTADVTLMKELFLDPLANATRNPDSAGYEILGALTITRKDGSKEFYYVFAPWGHVKRGDTYLVADLSELNTALKEGFQDSFQVMRQLQKVDK